MVEVMNDLFAGNSFGFLGGAMTELSDSSADPHKFGEVLSEIIQSFPFVYLATSRQLLSNRALSCPYLILFP